MRKILIVGAGHAGLMLALGLQSHGYDVTVMSDRTADEIRHGRVTSTQMMWRTALEHERDFGLALWDEQAPNGEGFGMAIGPEGVPIVEFNGRFEGSVGQSIDQRVKMSRWMDLFTERGGHLVVHGVTVSDLDWYALRYDLVLVAAGKGEIVSLFDRDASRSPFTTPQRALAVSYVHGMVPREGDPWKIGGRFNSVPGVGDLMVMPGLTHTGPCDILLLEALPGGPMDVFASIRDPYEHWRTMLDIVQTYIPWEYGRLKDAELTDPGGVLTGAFAPVVRRPVGELPSGGLVLGIADVVVANDPLTGQGANGAAKSAAHYLDRIVSHGDAAFDRPWMTDVFETYWEATARHATKWANTMLMDAPQFRQMLIGSAGMYSAIADRLARGFNDPSDFEHWFYDEDRAMAYLAEAANGGEAAVHS